MKKITLTLIIFLSCKIAGAQVSFNASSDTVTIDHNGIDIIETFYGNYMNYGKTKDFNYAGHKLYYSNGNLKEEMTIKDGRFAVGPCRTYYENGNCKEFYFCTNGNRDGIYISFYNNKKMKVMGEYSAPEKMPDYYVKEDTVNKNSAMSTSGIKVVRSYVFNDKKDGKWYYWTENGVLIKSEIWDKGKLIRIE